MDLFANIELKQRRSVELKILALEFLAALVVAVAITIVFAVATIWGIK